MWIAGKQVDGPEAFEITSPYDGRAVGTTTWATTEQVEDAVAAAHALKDEAAALPIHVRADALAHVSGQIAARAEEFAELITGENGKPLVWSRAEVGRAVSVFRLAAEEARRWSGEAMRLDGDKAATGRLAYVRRVPKGPVLAISPFNFPLNLVAHKVAPAIAVGAPLVLKPAPKTPLSALLLAELVAETDLPAGMLNVVNVQNDQASSLVADERLPVISFTGSGPVGWSIQKAVPHKHVTLELGGNAAAVICRDWDSRGRPRLGRDPDRHLLQLPGRAVLHRRAAGLRRRGRLRRLQAATDRQGGGARDRRPVRRLHPGRPGDQPRRRRADRDLGAGGGRRRARRCSPVAVGTDRRSSRPCSKAWRPMRRCPARRSSDRSS